MVNFYSEWQDFENPDELKAITIDCLCLKSANSNVNHYLSRKEENICYTEILDVENKCATLSKNNPIKIKYITDLNNMNGIEKDYILDPKSKKIIFLNSDLDNHSILVCYYFDNQSAFFLIEKMIYCLICLYRINKKFMVNQIKFFK